MLILACVFFSGWLLASLLGSWAYFAGDRQIERSLIREV